MTTDEEKVRDITKRLDRLKSIRYDFEAEIDQAITYVNHGILKITDTTKGARTGTEVYDDTAIRANNLRAMGLHGYLFSPGWFKLTLSDTLQYPRYSVMRKWSGKRIDEMPEVADWLSDTQEVMYGSFTSSNWYSITTEIFRTGGATGTVPIFVERDVNRDRIVFSPAHVRECYLSRNPFGDVDGLFHVRKYCVKDLLAKFGMATMVKAEPNFRQKTVDNPYEELEITHAVYEREQQEYGREDAKNMRFASCWLYGTKLLMESGYPYFPWIVYDERLNSNEWYARSPGMDAIVAIKLANQQGKTNLMAGWRAADPPYALMESLRGRANFNPHGRTWLKQNEVPPVIMDQNLRGLPVAMEFQERTDRAINEYFHTDVFMMMNRIAMENKNLTATQVVEMTGEKAAILSSDTERIERSMFNPVIDLVFSLEYDAAPDGRPLGRIPMPPPVIFEMGITKLETDFEGPLSQARKRFYKAQGIKAAIEDIGMIAQLDPKVLRIPKWDKITRYVTKETLPADCMNTEEEYEAILAEEARMFQEQQAMAAATEAAKALPGAGKAPETGSPLSLLMGGSQE